MGELELAVRLQGIEPVLIEALFHVIKVYDVIFRTKGLFETTTIFWSGLFNGGIRFDLPFESCEDVLV